MDLKDKGDRWLKKCIEIQICCFLTDKFGNPTKNRNFKKWRTIFYNFWGHNRLFSKNNFQALTHMIKVLYSDSGKKNFSPLYWTLRNLVYNFGLFEFTSSNFPKISFLVPSHAVAGHQTCDQQAYFAGLLPVNYRFNCNIPHTVTKPATSSFQSHLSHRQRPPRSLGKCRRIHTPDTFNATKLANLWQTTIFRRHFFGDSRWPLVVKKVLLERARNRLRNGIWYVVIGLVIRRQPANEVCLFITIL